MKKTFAILLAAGAPLSSFADALAGPRYYFEMREVEAAASVDPELKIYAGQALVDDLKSRPEFTDDLGGAKGAAIAAEVKKRKLTAYRVSLKIAKLSREEKEPKPGGRLKRLQIGAKVTVLGVMLPGEKLAFSGDGETAVESEVAERAMDKEAASMARDVIKEAIKQAVDEAVTRLGVTKGAPAKERKRGKHK